MAATYFWLDLYSFLVSSLFVLYVPRRLWKLHGSTIKVVPSFRGHLKTILTIAFTAIQYIFLIKATVLPVGHGNAIPGAISVLAALGLCLLCFFEHRNSVRPSDGIIIYVGLLVVKDFIDLTRPSHYYETMHLIPLIARLLILSSLLVAESMSKIDILDAPYQSLVSEELSGAFGRVLFWWINPVLKEGHRGILFHEDLPRIDQAFSSGFLRERIIHAWKCRSNPHTRFTLPLVLMKCFQWEFLSPVLPRLFLIIFRYAQPTLISITIGFVQNEHAPHTLTDAGYWLIILTAIIYSGLAISTSSYRHQLNRLQVMTRGALVGLIHAKSLRAEISPVEDRKALTLMSTDVDNVSTVAEMFHETWAQVTEVLIGTTLLAREIGWFALLPLIIIFGCSRMSAYVAKHLQGRQRDWSLATQQRLEMITSVLGSIKSMKILELDDAVISLVTNLRAREISLSKRLGWIMLAHNASANALGIFAPVLTLVLFAIFRSVHSTYAMDADIVFTSVALLALVTHPANMVMTIVPRAVASLANFQRIQALLAENPLLDKRENISPREHALESQGSLAISLEKVTLHPPSSTSPIIEDVSLSMNEGSILMCSGPMGSGKSALALSILGEINPVQGTIAVSDKRIGFYSQPVWLPTASIREVICGGSSVFDREWYITVINACCLASDLESFVDKDMTWVGTGGVNLSGGQKSRIALARVVYSRPRLVVLDDPFSALDGETERGIVDALFGPQGIFRKTCATVFLISSATQYYYLADKVVLLEDGQVQILDPTSDILRAKAQMSKMRPPPKDGESTEFNKVSDLTNRTRRDDAAADLSRRTGDLGIYKYYFGTFGILSLVFMTSCTAIYAFFLTFSQYLLKWWTESSSTQSWLYMPIYFLASLMAWMATNGNMWSTRIIITPKSGSALHSRLLGKIMNAPLSYFSEFKIGTVLNRFGQDIQLVDKQLPSALANLSTQVFKLLMQAIILFVVRPNMAITLPLVWVCMYFIQRVYLRTSRQLRFIDIESNSGLYTSFFQTIDGIATIRAFGWEGNFEADNIEKLDASQRPLYLLLCLQRWLNVVLDLVIAGIAVVLVASSVALRGTATGADIGVALNMIIAANATLLRLVENWTNLETSLGAIARLKSVDKDTPSEESGHDYLEPPLQWPAMGSIKLRHLSTGYYPDVPVLRDLNMDIQAGQKLILCGRTGSGKSSFFLSLLRLLDIQTGSLEVDDVDVSRTPLCTVRRRCFIAVPQDPFILPHASVRFNLDPYNEHNDTALCQALERTGLSSHFSTSMSEERGDSHDMPDSDIFHRALNTFPPLSTGQMQMLAFAQALLRAQPSARITDPLIIQRKPILILDEASSSLDLETEAQMQELLQQEFTKNGHTVIIIAHRLNHVMKDMRPGLDGVVLVDDGKMEVHG